MMKIGYVDNDVKMMVLNELGPLVTSADFNYTNGDLKEGELKLKSVITSMANHSLQKARQHFS